MTDVDRKRRLANERKGRRRKRERNGEIVAPCVVGNDVIGMLIDLGFLSVSESENRDEIGAALVELARAVDLSDFSGTRGHTTPGARGSMRTSNKDFQP